MGGTSSTRKASRANTCASRKSRRRMGVATSRLSCFFWRICTMPKPSPHIPVLIRLSPMIPGITQSM